MSEVSETIERLHQIQREAEALPALRKALELIENGQWIAGSLVQYGRIIEGKEYPACYCALGAVARGSDPDSSDEDIALLEYSQVNREAVAALAEALAGNPVQWGAYNYVWRVNDSSVAGKDAIVTGLRKAIAKLEAQA